MLSSHSTANISSSRTSSASARSFEIMKDTTFAVNGNWCRGSFSADNIDLEGQTISSTHAPFVPPVTPEPVRVAPAPARTPHSTFADAINDFFGTTQPRGTRESQHDSRPSLGGEPLPPPYQDAQLLPAYSAEPNTEPATLAMYLFKFGFLFPPFWILGAIVLIFPLTAPADFELSKSGTERQQLIQMIRDTELKWAQRCVWALFVLLMLGGGAAAIAFALSYS